MSFNTNRAYDYDDSVHYLIRYEMDKSIQKVERVIYGALDWLGDIGGFNEALVWIVSAVIYLFQFDMLNQFLIDKLYSYDQENNSA